MKSSHSFFLLNYRGYDCCVSLQHVNNKMTAGGLSTNGANCGFCGHDRGGGGITKPAVGVRGALSLVTFFGQAKKVTSKIVEMTLNLIREPNRHAHERSLFIEWIWLGSQRPVS